MTIDTKYFKRKLLEEKTAIETDLSKVARINPDYPTDWEAVPDEKDSTQGDENTDADSIDRYETNNAVVNTLEPRLRDTNDALEKIENGTYGLCEVCQEEIESDRLEANSSARTCKEHME